MLTNWLLDNRWFGPLVAGLLLVGLPVLGAWGLRRPVVGRVLLVVSVAAVLVLTMLPTGRSSPFGVVCTVQWSLPSFGSVELMANVLVFVPPVLFTSLVLRSPLRGFPLGTVASVGIEAVQAAVLAIGRSCDTTDWLCNTLGAAAGAFLAWAVPRAHACTRGDGRVTASSNP